MKKSSEEIVFNIIAFTITILLAIICLLPILYTISGSFTKERELLRGLKLIPSAWSLDAYRMVFRNSGAMFRAYGVTIALVIIGTVLSVLMSTMTAYVIYRKDCKYRNGLAFFFFFTTLFSGGLVPQYIVMCELGLRNTFTGLLLYNVFTVFNMIIVRSYFSSNIPMSLVESAKIDGANDFDIYLRIVMPSAGPIIATVALMTAIRYWNDWSTAAIFITDSKLYPLQYYLYKIFQEANLAEMAAQSGANVGNHATESYKLAMTVFTMGPVVLFYPFVQKYFVAGATVGAIKE